MSEAALVAGPMPVATGWEGYRRDAQRYFRWSLALTGVLTAVWLFFVVTGRDGGDVFKGYQLSRDAVVRVAIGFLIMSVLWGWLWYGIKGAAAAEARGLLEGRGQGRVPLAHERGLRLEGACSSGTRSGASGSPTWWAGAGASSRSA